MSSAQTLFEQAAVNASGTPVGLPVTPRPNLPPSQQVRAYGHFQGLGQTLDGLTDSPIGMYALLTLGGAGLGALVAQLTSKKPGRYGSAAQGALLQGGTIATLSGMFGASLSTPMRIGFGALGVGCLAGAYMSRR